MGDEVNRPPITHVAVRFRGKIWSLPPPNRHHDILRMIVEQTGATTVDSHGDDQGFLDASGRYLNRKQALLSAELNEQVKDPDNVRCGQLFSEDLW
jgi:hypothetical protein